MEWLPLLLSRVWALDLDALWYITPQPEVNLLVQTLKGASLLQTRDILTHSQSQRFLLATSTIIDSTNKPSSQAIPEVLYHTILTVINYPHDTSGASRTVFILKTHSTLEAAKAYTIQSLKKLNFKSDDFQKYHVRGRNEGVPDKAWIHGGGVLSLPVP